MASPSPVRPVLPDADARRLAQTEFERPVVLEAGAGTGKTTTLVARILAWCLGPGWERAETRETERETPAGRGKRDSKEKDPETPERVAVRVLRGVVALTFTEAAAAEMAERVGRELGRLAAGEAPPDWLHLEGGELPLLAAELWRMRARALVSALDHLTVTTLHAWCLGLLSTYPLEAGLHPRLQVDADGRLVDEAVAEAVETTLGRAYGRDPEGEDVYLELAARGVGPGEVADALCVLVREGVRPAALQDDPGSPDACEDLYRSLVDAGRRLAQPAAVRLEAAKRVGKAQDTVRAVRDLLARLEDLSDPEDELGPGALESSAERFPDGARERLKDWARERLTQSEADALDDTCDEVCAAARELLDLLDRAKGLEKLSLAHRGLAPLLRAVRRELRAAGTVTFQDLLTGAADLLTGSKSIHRAVVTRVRRKIDQLLVDEFQDTDALQCRLLHALALEGPEADRPGLFLVGDPKQSIYGWRNADLAAYGAFVREVEAAGGLRAPLLTNFRSTPALLDEVTRIVEPVMDEERDLQPPFEPLLPSPHLEDAPPFSKGGRHAVEHWISWHRDAGPATRNADADQVEAAAVARDLWDLHHRHDTSWRSMALLLRSSTHLEPYLEALRRTGVPFQVSGDRQYYRRREVIEAVALVRAVLDPGDALALLTLLRSSMVGVPDAALLPLWHHELPRRVMAVLGAEPEEAQRALLDELAEEIRAAAREIPRGIPGLDRLGGWPDALIAAVCHLVAARRSFREDPVDVFVARLRDLFLPEPIEAARYLGAYRLANLDRFFRTLAQGLEEGGDVGAVLRLLRRSVAEALEVPESPPPEGASDAVQVLTIHSAKGLEFDHVYFVQLHRGSGGGSGDPTQVLRAGDELALRLLGAAGAGYSELDERRRRVEAAEQVRLLYVAMTRAKQRLVLTGNPAGRSGGRGRPMTDLLARRRESPRDLEERWRREEAELRDEAGALWRFPALAVPEGTDTADATAEASMSTGGKEVPDAGRITRDARLLTERRRRAESRQARPLSGAASEEAHDRLRDLLGEQLEAADAETGARTGTGSREPSEPEPGERRRRLEVGTAVHAVLEQLDLERLALGEVTAELEHRKKALRADLARRLSPGDLPAALERAEDLLRRFADGPLMNRLATVAGSVLARELPVLLPAPEDAPGETASSYESPGNDNRHRESSSATRPLDSLAGAIDLLYRDPETGELVIVDFKTDEVESDEDVVRRAGAYAPQGEVYRRAIEEALGLPEPPRFELWFLHAGRVVGMG